MRAQEAELPGIPGYFYRAIFLGFSGLCVPVVRLKRKEEIVVFCEDFSQTHFLTESVFIRTTKKEITHFCEDFPDTAFGPNGSKALDAASYLGNWSLGHYLVISAWSLVIQRQTIWLRLCRSVFIPS